MTGVDLRSVTVSNIERVTHRQSVTGVGLQTISDSQRRKESDAQAGSDRG